MRIDMPGEEYGLDFMDLHYRQRGHWESFNIGHALVRTRNWGKMKPIKPKRSAKMRGKMLKGTRIILDPIAVLDNPTLYRQRGWLQWDKHSVAAKRLLLEKMAADKLPIDSEPSGFYAITKRERVDRWPPSVSKLQNLSCPILELGTVTDPLSGTANSTNVKPI
jgi:hypothetical protein